MTQDGNGLTTGNTVTFAAGLLYLGSVCWGGYYALANPAALFVQLSPVFVGACIVHASLLALGALVIRKSVGASSLKTGLAMQNAQFLALSLNWATLIAYVNFDGLFKAAAFWVHVAALFELTIVALIVSLSLAVNGKNLPLSVCGHLVGLILIVLFVLT